MPVRKIEIVKNTVAAKRPVRSGDIVELDDAEAQFLIHRGKAKAYVAPVSPAASDTTPEPETPAPPRRRGRQKNED